MSTVFCDYPLWNETGTVLAAKYTVGDMDIWHTVCHTGTGLDDIIIAGEKIVNFNKQWIRA